MILKHKNPNITTLVHVIKVQYRDLKRIKMKIELIGFNLRPFNVTVKHDWFNNFVDYRKEVMIPLDNEELLKLDNEKEKYEIIKSIESV